jgi:RNA polymerase sigma-70 factor (ECF subfamily)
MNTNRNHIAPHDEVDDHRDDRFIEAWQEHHDRLVARAARMLADTGAAEDVVQEAFRRLHGVPLDEIDDVGGWLAVVVRRLCLNRLRTAYARHEAVGIDAEAAGTAVAGTIAVDVDPLDRVTLDDEVQTALAVMLDTLSPAERTAFVLHDVFGFQFDAVATIVGRSPAAVRQLASRARRSIREAAPHEGTRVDASGHDVVVERFIAACEGGDINELVAVLDPAVDGHAELIGFGTIAEQAGRADVARQLIGLFGPETDTLLVPVTVEGDAGFVAYLRGQLAAVVRIEHDGHAIRRFRAFVLAPSSRQPLT